MWLILICIGFLLGLATAFLPVLEVLSRLQREMRVTSVGVLLRILFRWAHPLRRRDARSLERRIVRRMQSQRFVFSSGATYAMRHLDVRLSPDDLVTLTSLIPEQILIENLEGSYRSFAQRSGWRVPSGRLHVTIHEDVRLPLATVDVLGALAGAYVPPGDASAFASDRPDPTLPLQNQTDPRTTRPLNQTPCTARVYLGELDALLFAEDDSYFIGAGIDSILPIEEDGLPSRQVKVRHAPALGWIIGLVNESSLAYVDGRPLTGDVVLPHRAEIRLKEGVVVSFLTSCVHPMPGARVGG